MMRRLWTAASAMACLLMSVASQNVDPIVIKGSKFFYKSNGTQL